MLSAVFAPANPLAAKATTTTTTIRNETNEFSRDCTVFLGVENTVLEYDLRHSDSPILCTEPTKEWGQVLQNQDEVNQIGLSYHNNKNNHQGTKKKKQKKKGGNKKQQPCSGKNSGGSLYLAACDDAGKVRWTEASSSSSGQSSQGNNCSDSAFASSTILHHDNNGVAVVPACAFRPIGQKRAGGGSGVSLELVSGGTDCKLQLWDVLRPKYVVIETRSVGIQLCSRGIFR